MARIAGVNIPQNKLVNVGLTYIYGIGDRFSNQICNALEISKSKRETYFTIQGLTTDIFFCKNTNIETFFEFTNCNKRFVFAKDQSY